MYLVMLLGLLVVAITVAIHVVGSAIVMDFLERDRHSGTDRISLGRAAAILAGTSVLLLSMHVVQVIVWAVAYICLPDLPDLDSFSNAAYFSIVTYTTLGYGDITITGPWRLLAGIEAMNGILLFGWSTALLFAVVQRLTRTAD